MLRTLLRILIIVFFPFLIISPASGEIVVGNFSEQPQNGLLPEHWEPLVFDGVDTHTIYTHCSDGDKGSIQATSRAGSSGLVRKLNIDSTHSSTISFRWKIQDIIESADLTRRKKEDAPARLYVTFAYDSSLVRWWEVVKFEAIRLFYGEYPPIASLLYVWASHGKQGTIMESAYTNRVKIIVLEAGAAKKGQWVSEKRDIRADYLAAFASTDIPMISGVAIMTDTDNTGSQAVAWYGDIIFSDSLSTPE